jgi:hypothetical protein
MHLLDQAVDDPDVVPVPQKFPRDVPTDEAAASGDQDSFAHDASGAGLLMMVEAECCVSKKMNVPQTRRRLKCSRGKAGVPVREEGTNLPYREFLPEPQNAGGRT